MEEIRIEQIITRPKKPSFRLRKKIRSRFQKEYRRFLLTPTLKNLIRVARIRWDESGCCNFASWHTVFQRKKDHVKWVSLCREFLYEKITREKREDRKNTLLYQENYMRLVHYEKKKTMPHKKYVEWIMKGWGKNTGYNTNN